MPTVFLRGCAVTLQLNITDPSTVDDNGDPTPLDMSAAEGIILTLKDETDTVWQQFSKVQTGDFAAAYDDIDVTESAAGILSVDISEPESLLCAIGKVYLTGKITIDGKDYGIGKVAIGTMQEFALQSVATH